MIHGTLYKTRFTEIGFTLNSPADWRFVDLSDAQDGNKDHMHCIGTSYPTKEQLLLNVERYAAEYGCDGASKRTVIPNVFLVTLTMDSEADGDYHHYWICATREECFRQLSAWVKREEEGFVDDPTGDVDAYFATSEDTYDITEMPVLGN
jgi:hypothetical protein